MFYSVQKTKYRSKNRGGARNSRSFSGEHQGRPKNLDGIRGFHFVENRVYLANAGI